MAFIKKKLFKILVISCCLIICLTFSPFSVIAASENKKEDVIKVEKISGGVDSQVHQNVYQENKNEKSSSFSFLYAFNRRISFLLWPLIFIASKSMDNSLVYGKIIGLDKYLWYLWNIMKSFSSFFIGFLFILSVLFYFFGYKQEKFNPKKILPLTIIAIVLVNASWWLIGVLVDLSTVLTVSVGGLVNRVLYKDESFNKNGIFLPIVNVDLSKLDQLKNSTGLYVGYIGNDKKIYLPCIFINKKLSGDLLEKNADHFEKFLKKIGLKDMDVRSDYCYISYGGLVKVVEVGKCSTEKECIKEAKSISSVSKGFSYKQIIEDKGLFLGPFYYLFLSIINYGGIYNDNISNSTQNLKYLGPIFIGKAIFIFLLLIPLFIFAIIMIVRVFVLWLVIIFSPFIFLFNSLSLGMGKFFEKFSLNNILSLIFMPVIVSLTLGFGVLILQLINNNFIIKNLLSYSKTGDVGYVLDLGIKLELKSNYNFSYFQDLVGWFFVNLFGIMILWSLIFAALRVNKFTEGFVVSLEKFSKSLVMSLPVLPIPTTKGVEKWSVLDIKNFGERVNNLPSDIVHGQYNRKIEKFFKELFGDKSEETDSKDGQKNKKEN